MTTISIRRRIGAAIALLLACGAAFALATGTIEVGQLPREARTVLAAIRAGGPFAYAKDGSTFGNYEGVLPRQKRGYYREFTVDTPGARNRGARRVVCGGEARDWSRNAPAACWYTDDHYATFRRIQE
jgi:ribonuclease T1